MPIELIQNLLTTILAQFKPTIFTFEILIVGKEIDIMAMSI